MEFRELLLLLIQTNIELHLNKMVFYLETQESENDVWLELEESPGEPSSHQNVKSIIKGEMIVFVLEVAILIFALLGLFLSFVGFIWIVVSLRFLLWLTLGLLDPFASETYEVQNLIAMTLGKGLNVLNHEQKELVLSDLKVTRLRHIGVRMFTLGILIVASSLEVSLRLR